MTAATKLEPIDWQTYLKGEEVAARKHEYVHGRIYAMAGAKNRHHLINSNVLVALANQLRGSKCRALGSDLKVRIRTALGYRFYYPDVTVDCEPLKPDLVYTDTPSVVIETLSRSTRRLDEGEKRDGYLQIPSLKAYILVDSERLGVTVWRRHDNEFKSEVFIDLAASIPLPEIGVTLPLAEVYANVVWSEAKEEDEDE